MMTLLLSGSIIGFGAQGGRPAASARVAGYSFDVISRYAREPDAYTQGLALRGTRLFEGTGLYGESRLRETVLEAGRQRVIRERLLPDAVELSPTQRRYQAGRLSTLGYAAADIERKQSGGLMFGEGIAILGERIYQLTWVEGVCFVWDVANWTQPARVHRYSGEGWGLTYDGTHLIMSDGSATLQFRDPKTFDVTRTVQVKDPRTGAAVARLNELEFVNGKVFANVYETRRVAIVNPKTGTLEGYVVFDGGRELTGPQWPLLLPRVHWDQLDARGEVLNGIAYDAASDRLIVTGKKWPTVYEVKVRKVEDSL
jgi:glutamine cyclotransferase